MGRGLLGCVGWGTVNTSLIFLAAIVILVTYLTITKSDRLDRPVSAA